MFLCYKHTDLLSTAPEDASPATLKKQKPTKVATESKSKSKPKTAAKKKEEPVEEPEAADSEDEDENDDANILATTLDSDEDEVAEGASLFKEGQDVGKIPKVSKQVKDAAKPSDGEPGVIYIGRIPHGFYEFEMRQYFQQFGDISRLRLSRNKKTGASKHFAFVEFADKSTAEVVAKTMDNYLLFGHILKCKVIPKSDVHDNLFKGANKRFKKVPWNKIVGKDLEKPRTQAQWEGKISKEQSKRSKQAAKLKAMGYDFDMPDLKSAPAPVAKPAAEDSEEVKALPATNGEEETPKKAEKKTKAATEKKATATKATKAKKAKA